MKQPAAYYNEHDEHKAEWLRELIRKDVIADGEVDERNIKLVRAEDLTGFAQCHFFAGVGVWSYALRLAGWPDDRECWTGSCPCPSFSAAGKGGGFDDPRHLWPDWVRLIHIGKPAVIFGEQADDAIGYGWLDLVQTDLEAKAYAVGKAVLGACSVGGSDIRQRLYWTAYAAERGFSLRTGEQSGIGRACAEADGLRSSGRLEHSERTRLEGHAGNGDYWNEPGRLGADATRSTSEAGAASRLADSNGRQSRNGTVQRSGEYGLISQDGETVRMADSMQPGRASWRSQSGNGSSTGSRGIVEHPAADALNGFWRDADWLFCTDGFWRPVEAGTFPLAHGAPARLGLLRGYGDAINAEVAKVFIEESYAAQIETETP